uniref:Twin-arginine translocation pathway signal n=1 Tax=Solibacter usitatus (strain Ellin6076) TaxID=234267 RepID=Q02CJ2_SOLUE
MMRKIVGLRNLSAGSPRELAQAISLNRRSFLRSVTGAGAAAALFGPAALRGIQAPRAKKVVVVTFGGGARDEETFMPDGQENIPHLLNQLIPQATFFSQVVNRGILGHYVATASIVTGAYETFNNFASVSPDNPTVFEYFRKDLKRPATDCWVVAPSNGFAHIGESAHRSFGPGTGAGVILPKRLLSAALSAGSERDRYRHLLRDNYETPLYAPTLTGREIDLNRMADVLKLSVDDFAAHARSLASPDEMSVYVAKHLMRQLSPSLLWVTLHDIDVAHSGTFSLYLDGIRRCDRLCSELWQAIQKDPEYANRTAMFILPDFGRDSDIDSGGNGFQHHRTGDPMSRTTWMMALGPGIRQNVVVDRPVESTDLIPTLGSMLGFEARYAQGKPVVEVA